MLHEYTAVIKGNGLTLRGGKRQYRVCYILILSIISGNQVNGMAIFSEQHVAVVIGYLNRALRINRTAGCSAVITEDDITQLIFYHNLGCTAESRYCTAPFFRHIVLKQKLPAAFRKLQRSPILQSNGTTATAGFIAFECNASFIVLQFNNGLFTGV